MSPSLTASTSIPTAVPLAPTQSRPHSRIYVHPRAAPAPPGPEAYSANIRPSLRSFKVLRKKKSNKTLKRKSSSIAPFTNAPVSPAAVKVPPTGAVAFPSKHRNSQHLSLPQRWFLYPFRAFRALRGDRLEEASKRRDSRRISQDLELLPPKKSSFKFAKGAKTRFRRALFLSRLTRSRRAKANQFAKVQNRHSRDVGQKRQVRSSFVHKASTRANKSKPSRNLSKGKERLISNPLGPVKGSLGDFQTSNVIAGFRPRVDSTKACPNCNYSAKLCLCDVTLSGMDKFGSVAYCGHGPLRSASNTTLSSNGDMGAIVPLSVAEGMQHPFHLAPPGRPALGVPTSTSDSWTDVSWSNSAATSGSSPASASQTLTRDHSEPSIVQTAPLQKPKPSMQPRQQPGSVRYNGSPHQALNPFQEAILSQPSLPQGRTLVAMPAQDNGMGRMTVTSPSPVRSPHPASILFAHRPDSFDPRDLLVVAPRTSPLPGEPSGIPSPHPSYEGSLAHQSRFENRFSGNSLAAPAMLPTLGSRSTIPSMWSRASFDPDSSCRSHLDSASANWRSHPDLIDLSLDSSAGEASSAGHTIVPFSPRDDGEIASTPLPSNPFGDDDDDDGNVKEEQQEEDSPNAPFRRVDSEGDVGLGLELPSPTPLPAPLRDRKDSSCLGHGCLASHESRDTSSSSIAGVSGTSSGRPSGLSRTGTLDKLLRDIENWTGIDKDTHEDSMLDENPFEYEERDDSSCPASSNPGAKGETEKGGPSTLPRASSCASSLSSRSIPCGADVTSSVLFERLRTSSEDTTCSDWVEPSTSNSTAGVASNNKRDLESNTEQPHPWSDVLSRIAEESESGHSPGGVVPSNPFLTPNPHDDRRYDEAHGIIDVSPLLCPSSSFDSELSGRDSSQSPAISADSSDPTSMEESDDAPEAKERGIDAKDHNEDQVEQDVPTRTHSWASSLSNLQTGQVQPILTTVENADGPKALPGSPPMDEHPLNPFAATTLTEFPQADRYARVTAMMASSTSLDQTEHADTSGDPLGYYELDTTGRFSDVDGEAGRAAFDASSGESSDAEESSMSRQVLTSLSRLTTLGESGTAGTTRRIYSQRSLRERRMQEQSAEGVSQYRSTPREVPYSPEAVEVPVRRSRSRGSKRRRDKRKLSLVWLDDELVEAESSYISPTADVLDDYLASGGSVLP